MSMRGMHWHALSCIGTMRHKQRRSNRSVTPMRHTSSSAPAVLRIMTHRQGEQAEWVLSTAEVAIFVGAIAGQVTSAYAAIMLL